MENVEKLMKRTSSVNRTVLMDTFIQNVPYYDGKKLNAGFCIRVVYKNHFKGTGLKFHRLRPKKELFHRRYGEMLIYYFCAV